MTEERDLFGQPTSASRLGAMTDAERKRQRRRASEKPRGYAAKPGTGPEGETCGSCEHLFRHYRTRDYLKCKLNEAAWTHSSRTDVRARSPACAKWEKQTSEPDPTASWQP